jgi:hypothetical protein
MPVEGINVSFHETPPSDVLNMVPFLPETHPFISFRNDILYRVTFVLNITFQFFPPSTVLDMTPILLKIEIAEPPIVQPIVLLKKDDEYIEYDGSLTMFQLGVDCTFVADEITFAFIRQEKSIHEDTNDIIFLVIFINPPHYYINVNVLVIAP